MIGASVTIVITSEPHRDAGSKVQTPVARKGVTHDATRWPITCPSSGSRDGLSLGCKPIWVCDHCQTIGPNTDTNATHIIILDRRGRQNRLKRLRIAAREVLRSAKRPCSRRCVLLLSRPSPRRFRRPLVTYLTLPHLAFASPCSVSLRSARANSLLLLGGSVCRVLNPRWRTIPRTHRKWAGNEGNKASTGKSIQQKKAAKICVSALLDACAASNQNRSSHREN